MQEVKRMMRRRHKLPLSLTRLCCNNIYRTIDCLVAGMVDRPWFVQVANPATRRFVGMVMPTYEGLST